MVNNPIILKVFALFFLVIQLMVNVADASETHSRTALRSVVRALKSVPSVNKVYSEKRDRINTRVKGAVSDIGEAKTALVVIGAIVKVAVDGKISHKAKLSEGLSYKISADMKGNFFTTFDVDILKKSSYSVTAFRGKNDSGVTLGMNLDFD